MWFIFYVTLNLFQGLAIVVLPSIDTLIVANNLYKECRYEESAQKYETLIDLGIKSPLLYYNLGNCYFKLGKLGKATLYYKKAQRIAPADQDIEFNLRFARARRIDKIENNIPEFLSKSIKFLYQADINILIIVDTVLYWALISLISISLLVGSARIHSPPLQRTIKIWLPLALGIAVIITLLNIERINRNEWVLLENVAEIRSGPSRDYTPICTIHEGMEFRILDEQEGWAKIVLPNGIQGWVKGTIIGKV